MTSLMLITSSNHELTVNSNLGFFNEDYEIDGIFAMQNAYLEHKELTPALYQIDPEVIFKS